MPGLMRRYVANITATIANGGTASNAIQVSEYSFGGFAIPSAFTGATVSFTGCETEDGTFTAIHDSTNTVISRTVTASKRYALPAEVFSFRYIKIVSASAEDAARSVEVTLKG